VCTSIVGLFEWTDGGSHHHTRTFCIRPSQPDNMHYDRYRAQFRHYSWLDATCRRFRLGSFLGSFLGRFVGDCDVSCGLRQHGIHVNHSFLLAFLLFLCNGWQKALLLLHVQRSDCLPKGRTHLKILESKHRSITVNQNIKTYLKINFSRPLPSQLNRPTRYIRNWRDGQPGRNESQEGIKGKSSFVTH
jgi:hypothetical protein